MSTALAELQALKERVAALEKLLVIESGSTTQLVPVHGNERIRLPEIGVVIEVVQIRKGYVKLKFHAPEGVVIERGEDIAPEPGFTVEQFAASVGEFAPTQAMLDEDWSDLDRPARKGG